MQEEMFEAIANNNSFAVMLKSPTASGKLEAILLPALAKGYRLILPLLARSLLEDQKARIEKYLKKLSELQQTREISLVVDTGAQMYRWFIWLAKILLLLSINSRRHLYKGDVILTTLNKFLYHYFAFGDKQKSFIFPLRINQEKNLICFDEAHTYNKISFTNFHSLVKVLYEAGRSLILMTVTMPPEHIKERFDYLELLNYIDVSENVEKLEEFQKETLKQHYLNQRNFEWISQSNVSEKPLKIFRMSLLILLSKSGKQKKTVELFV